MKRLKLLMIWYLAAVGLAAHLAAVAVWLLHPAWVWRAEELVTAWVGDHLPFLAYGDTARKQIPDAQVFAQIPAWKPLPGGPDAPAPGSAVVAGRRFQSIQEALDAAQPGATVDIGAGVYATPLVVRVPRITIVGHGHVVFEKGEAQGKGNMVIVADDVQVRNIECRLITVRDHNGACIRLEGKNLTVEHVYYHDSEQGILTGDDPGRVDIRDSRFERLGQGGQAHGIYIGRGQLSIADSLFLAGKDEGHEIKTRAAETTIVRSVIASLNGLDSRLIDAPNGGILTVTDSVLAEGPNTANSDMIGFALETGLGKHPVDRVIIRNNLVLIDRDRPTQLLHLSNEKFRAFVSGNVIVSHDKTPYEDANTVLRTRKEAGLPEYPALPLRQLRQAAAASDQ